MLIQCFNFREDKEKAQIIDEQERGRLINWEVKLNDAATYKTGHTQQIVNDTEEREQGRFNKVMAAIRLSRAHVASVSMAPSALCCVRLNRNVFVKTETKHAFFK